MTELEIQFGTSLWNADLATVHALLREHPELSSFLGNPEHQRTYLERAAGNDDLEVVKFLVQQGADVHAPLDSTVHVGVIYVAVRKGALNVTRWLLEQGADPHDVCDGVRRCQPLLSAAMHGDLDMIRLLVEQGHAEINATWCNNNALSFAVSYGFEAVADYLRSRGARLPDELDDSSAAAAKPQSLAAHLAEVFGLPARESIVEIVPSRLPITIHVLQNDEEGHQLLVTEGMSARAMTVPKGQAEYRYAELALRLPLDWPLDDKSLEDPQYSWPIVWMRKIALYPHANKTWLRGKYAVIANEEPPQPLGPGTELSCWLAVNAIHRYGVWKRSPRRAVQFYDLIPLYAEERDLEAQQGLRVLFDRFEESMIDPIIDAKRINVAIVE